MENLTQDQAEIIFSLFIAQNADKKISDLFPSDDEYKKEIIGNLVIVVSDYSVRLTDISRNHFRIWSKPKTNKCKKFSIKQIIKLISFEDKI